MNHVQVLESRRLLTTVAQGVPGFYEAHGTPGDDSIVVVIDQAAGTFTLDGVTYTGALHLTVYANAGNDTVSVTGSAPGPISASVYGGPGADTLTRDGDGALRGEDGNDTLTLRNAFRGEAYGGPGDDYMTIAGNCIETQIEGNDGNDTIWANNNNYSVVLFGGSGNDKLYGSQFNDALFDGPGTDFVFGLGGNDEFDSRDGTQDWIMGGDGTDSLWRDPIDSHNGVETLYY